MDITDKYFTSYTGTIYWTSGARNSFGDLEIMKLDTNTKSFGTIEQLIPYYLQRGQKILLDDVMYEVESIYHSDIIGNYKVELYNKSTGKCLVELETIHTMFKKYAD